MKIIELSDEDYAEIMELSKELQEQENDSQAFPYFWSPRSTRKTIGTEDDEAMIYSDGEVSTPAEYAEENHEVWLAFLESIDKGECQFDESLAETFDWQDFITSNDCDCYIVYQKEENISENNFSLFKSDVKGHIECNRHHLGKDPHTYANTVFRMPKMRALIEMIYKLNNDKNIKLNREAAVYVGRES